MEDVNLKQIYFYVKSKIKIIIVVFFLSLILGFGYTFFNKKIIYQAESSLVLLTNIISNSEMSNNFTVQRDLVSTYSDMIKSTTILNKVIDELKLETNYISLSNKVSVKTRKESGLVKIIVVDSSEKNAKKIANEIANNFSKMVNDLVENNNTIAIVFDKAIEAERIESLTLVKVLIVFGITGIIGVICYILLKYYFDTTIKDEDDIKRNFNLKILGKIRTNNDFNLIKTKLLQKSLKKVVITSIENNEGRDEIVELLSKSLCKDLKVALIDSSNNFNVLKKNNDKIFRKKLKNTNIYIQKTDNNLDIINFENKDYEIDVNIINKLFKDLESQYDFIIIIGESVNKCSNTLLYSLCADGVILINKYNCAKMEKFKEILELFNDVNVNILGVIINKMKY